MQRCGLSRGVDQRELILEDYVGGILSGFLDEYASEKVREEQWDLKALEEAAQTGAADRLEPALARVDAAWAELRQALRAEGFDCP